MSKPRLKGDLIALRLPLAVDAHVRDRAAAKRISAGLYIADAMTRGYAAKQAASNTRTPTAAEVGEELGTALRRLAAVREGPKVVQ